MHRNSKGHGRSKSSPAGQRARCGRPARERSAHHAIPTAVSPPNTPTAQNFTNRADTPGLDRQAFSPFGIVTSGIDVVGKLYAGYGEGAPSGPGPSQSLLQVQGNAYLDKLFPKLDGIKTARVSLK